MQFYVDHILIISNAKISEWSDIGSPKWYGRTQNFEGIIHKAEDIVFNHYFLAPILFIFLYHQKYIIMRTLFTTFLCCYSWLMAAQLTLISNDFPNPADTFNLLFWSNVPKPNNFVGQTWDYSTLGAPSNSIVIFQKEELEAFINEGIDVYRSTTKSFNTDFSYLIDLEFDLNENALSEKGIYVPEQRYALTSFTGNNKDSLIMPLQGYVYNNTVDHLRFPLTFQKSWTSLSKRTVNFDLTVNAFNLKSVPAQHVWYAVRKDTILGYGTMKILTENGPSKVYDVLVDRIESYAVDSFYLAGNPAPVALLTGFGLSQGQRTNFGNRINFYRKDLFYYLASFFFGTRPFTGQPTELFVCTNRAELLSSTDEIQKTKSVVIYPNVLESGQDFHVMIQEDQAQQYRYTLSTITGNIVQSGSVNSNSLEQINRISDATAGTYILSVFDKKGQILTTQKMVFL